MSFLTELRRRKVVRTGLGYLGVAFVVLQAADLTFEPLGFARWSYTFVVITALAGLPIALVVAWFYDVTGRGVQRTEADPSAELRAATPGYRPATAAMLMVVAVVLLAGTAFTAYRLTLKRPADSATLAVFPFTVRSSSSHAYLRDAMVDLLSRNLDGVAGVRAIAPEMMLRIAEKESKAIEPRRAAELAEQLDAQLFLIGSVTQIGPEVQLSASLHEAGVPDASVAARTVRGDTAALFALIDQLSAQLMVARAGREGKRLAEVAALTTSSLAALREYVEGERFYRATLYDSALARFQSAASIDTTFAIAHYRLALAASSPSVALSAARSAARHSSGLAPRDRRLIEALSSVLVGHADEAEQAYRSLLADYPGDLEVMYQLAETLLWFNPARGRPLDEARSLYEKVLAADPGFLCPTCGLLFIANANRDYARMASLVAGLPRESPFADTVVLPSLREFMTGDSAARTRVWSRFQRASAFDIVQLATGLAEATHDYGAAERLIDPLVQPGRSKREQMQGYHALSVWAIERGRAREFLRYQAARRQAGNTRTPLTEAAHAAMPFTPFSKEQLQPIRDAVLLSDSVPPPHAVQPVEALRAHQRLYFLGTLSARLGDDRAALDYADRLERLTGKAEWEPVLDGMANEIRAHVAARQGKAQEALRIIESVPTTGPVELMVQHFPPYTTLFWRAELLFQNRRDQEAVRWFQNALAGGHEAGVYQPIVDLRLAQLYERQGERAKAIEHYGAFLRQWETADSVAWPLIEQGRQALRRLRAR